MEQTAFVVTLFQNKDDPNEVTVAAVMGLNALKLGHSATIILMVKAVELGQSGATQGIAIGSPFPEVSGVLEEYLNLGGKVAICNACMIHNGFTKEQMDPRFELIDAPDVVRLLMAARGTLQIT